MDITIGVLSLQGDVEEHIDALLAIKVDARGVKTPEDLADIDGLIIPGGESTTVGEMVGRFGLTKPLEKRVAAGMPVWGTCMGMILMAREVDGRAQQYTLGLLDISVERNAFGAQVHSFEDEVKLEGMKEPVLGVFIRAPIESRLGKAVDAIGSYDGKVVAVRQGKLLGTSFQPELTDDTRLHKWFLAL